MRNRAAKVIDRSGARIGGVITDIFGMNGRRILDGLVDRLDREAILGSLSRHVRGKLERLGDALTMSLRDADRVVLADLLREHDDLDRRIADLDRHLDEGMAEHDRRLRLLERIDRVSAIAILVEASPDAVAVFGSAQRLAAWAGVCPGNRESAGKRQGAHTRPGAKHLRTILIACAHAAARTPPVPSYHKALLVRRGYKRAVVATAHKLARAVFACATASPTATRRSTTRLLDSTSRTSSCRPLPAPPDTQTFRPTDPVADVSPARSGGWHRELERERREPPTQLLRVTKAGFVTQARSLPKTRARLSSCLWDEMFVCREGMVLVPLQIAVQDGHHLKAQQQRCRIECSTQFPPRLPPLFLLLWRRVVLALTDSQCLNLLGGAEVEVPDSRDDTLVRLGFLFPPPTPSCVAQRQGRRQPRAADRREQSGQNSSPIHRLSRLGLAHQSNSRGCRKVHAVASRPV